MMPHANTPVFNTELLAQALTQLDLSLQADCPRACAASAFMFGCMARDEDYGPTFCSTCASLSQTLGSWRRTRIAARTEVRRQALTH